MQLDTAPRPLEACIVTSMRVHRMVIEYVNGISLAISFQPRVGIAEFQQHLQTHQEWLFS